MWFILDRRKILDLLTGHTLYNDSSVAIREIMQNSIDTVKFRKHTNQDEEIGEVRIEWNTKNRELVVRDNGAGMSEEVLQKLFTSFFSTKGHRGTGLGLMVTRKLIEENKGKIEVTSRLNEGTTFTVRLPYEVKGEN